MQKSGTLRHEKVRANTGIIPTPKSLHIVAKNVSPCTPAEGAGGSAATLREVVAAFRRHLTEDGKSAKTVESYTGDVAGFAGKRGLGPTQTTEQMFAMADKIWYNINGTTK